MSSPIRYCIDTNSLVDCRSRYYPADVFPSLWAQIDRLADEGILVSHVEVLREIEKKSDDLFKWAQQRPKFFIDFDQDQEKVLIEILADHPRLVMNSKRMNAADPFLIAFAELKGIILITQEQPSNSENKPKIPDVCISRGVNYMGILDLFRAETISF